MVFIFHYNDNSVGNSIYLLLKTFTNFLKQKDTLIIYYSERLHNYPFLFSVCPAAVPDIANGMISSGDSAPFFINEMITYECNNNYDADGADLTNECMENAGDVVVPAVWSRMTADLTSVCRAGNQLTNEIRGSRLSSSLLLLKIHSSLKKFVI